LTGFAILAGGELNWVIENEDKKTATFQREKQAAEDELKAA
jgi:hypothetical protein